MSLKVFIQVSRTEGLFACRVCFASLAGSLAQAARRPRVKGFHAESLVRPLLRMARYCNSVMQSAAFLALGHLMSYPAAQQVLCEVSMVIRVLDAIHTLLRCTLVTGLALWIEQHYSVSFLTCKPPLLLWLAQQHMYQCAFSKHATCAWGMLCYSMRGVQDAKHLAILTDILEDAKAQLSLKVAVCTILRAAAQADAVSMSALTQVHLIAPFNEWCHSCRHAPEVLPTQQLIGRCLVQQEARDGWVQNLSHKAAKGPPTPLPKVRCVGVDMQYAGGRHPWAGGSAERPGGEPAGAGPCQLCSQAPHRHQICFAGLVCDV